MEVDGDDIEDTLANFIKAEKTKLQVQEAKHKAKQDGNDEK